MLDLGLQLKKYRELRGLTQKALAERISKSVGAISSYETNTQHPPLDVLLSIARVLNVKLNTLVGYDQDEGYPAQWLTPAQRELIDALFAEFTTPSGSGKELSDRQMEILRKLMLLFSAKE